MSLVCLKLVPEDNFLYSIHFEERSCYIALDGMVDQADFRLTELCFLSIRVADVHVCVQLS